MDSTTTEAQRLSPHSGKPSGLEVAGLEKACAFSSSGGLFLARLPTVSGIKIVVVVPVSGTVPSLSSSPPTASSKGTSSSSDKA
eukprot:CAMPEP_0194057196 /NCGR_PEP_ID=MMETSP0009_2-20130614/62624_1 /TAXON_ID=210454 /ORGANISM="Grammatophora oceanica, Strain CCMP 410" /LENGTH=83 /DNA_ID=CAMNT_0038706859 /DNA_START=101 /DNA_END=348 /DNA_ORIENTATION=-